MASAKILFLIALFAPPLLVASGGWMNRVEARLDQRKRLHANNRKHGAQVG